MNLWVFRLHPGQFLEYSSEEHTEQQGCEVGNQGDNEEEEGES